MSGIEDFPPNNEALEIEDMEEPPKAAERGADLLKTAEFEEWKKSAMNERVPSLFLDSSLKILSANDNFCRLFSCEFAPSGMYFTQFFAPYFEETRSAELFRAILSPRTGYTWSGRVEKTGREQLTTICKVWVVPILSPGSPTPRAFGAFCLDMTSEYRQLLSSTFASLLEAARLKDNDTGNHIERVNRYSRTLAKSLAGRPEWPQIDRQFIDSIGQVAALHDIGKIGTPDDILNKAGPLEPWEWDVMKQHTTNGAYILGTYPNPMAKEIALRHHERWDGTGYPHQLSGELIPLPARIAAIGDVYDALRMPRSYKEAFSHAAALETMRKEGEKHFDPALIGRLADVADEFNLTFTELGDSPQGRS